MENCALKSSSTEKFPQLNQKRGEQVADSLCSCLKVKLGKAECVLFRHRKKGEIIKELFKKELVHVCIRFWCHINNREMGIRKLLKASKVKFYGMSGTSQNSSQFYRYILDWILVKCLRIQLNTALLMNSLLISSNDRILSTALCSQKSFINLCYWR